MKTRHALTLVELLVVVAIIGMLVALLMPAVQSARESARRLTCGNNLKQMGIAMQQHIASQEHLPTGGWGDGWEGEPGRGYGIQQPGGWIYNLLSYMDSAILRDRAYDTVRRSAALAFFNCPTRRTGVVYENLQSGQGMAKSDYGANTVSGAQAFWSPACASYGNMMSVQGPGACGPPSGPPSYPTESVVNATADAARTTAAMVGVVFRLSTVRPAAIRDGLSNTYFGAEKAVGIDFYQSGQDTGDRVDNVYRGGTNLVANGQPNRDPQSSYAGGAYFGSAHVDSFNALFCDGSVRSIPYTITLTLHQNLCNRKDGQTTDLSGL